MENFKIGDRVKCVEDELGKRVGYIGTVVGIECASHNSPLVKVKWDNGYVSNLCKGFNLIFAYKLELYKDEPEVSNTANLSEGQLAVYQASIELYEAQKKFEKALANLQNKD